MASVKVKGKGMEAKESLSGNEVEGKGMEAKESASGDGSYKRLGMGYCSLQIPSD